MHSRTAECPIILTGPIDYICDASGQTVVCVKNGHEILGRITGAGCMVGTAVAVFCAGAASNDENGCDGRLVRGDMFLGAIGG
jgi:thiamine-phosphate diphosphorylase / hydroxyethylthiazole kinase